MITSIQAFFFSVPVDFRLAYSRKRFARWCLVLLEDEAGRAGIGCGTLYKRLPLGAHLYWRSILEPWLYEMADRPLDALRLDLQERMVKEAPGVVFALDTALWDLEARQQAVAVADLLGGLKREAVAITEQLFINEIADHRLIETMLERGTRSFKVKIGANLDREIAQIKALRERCGPDAEIRVDANRGLTLDEALRAAKELSPVGVSVFEEPLQDVNRLAEFRASTGCRVMLDESIRDATVLDRLANGQNRGVDGVNLKLARVGGLTGAVRLAKHCHELGLETAVGCAEDLGAGMAANLVLSGCLESAFETEGYGAPRVNVWSLDDGLMPFQSPMQVPGGPGFGQPPVDVASFRREIRKRGGVVGRGDRLQAGFFARESWNRLVQGWNTLEHRVLKRL